MGTVCPTSLSKKLGYKTRTRFLGILQIVRGWKVLFFHFNDIDLCGLICRTSLLLNV